MSPSHAFPLVAVDVGNSRVKVGLFDRSTEIEPFGLPTPRRTLQLDPRADKPQSIDDWLGEIPAPSVSWWIGSVQRSLASQLIDWLRNRAVRQITLLASADLPLAISVPRPDMVGIDRLLGAVAVNQLRPDGAPAVVVDMGTAVTVDLISAEGAFLGGAIMPGIGLSARALHEFTDLLPMLDMPDLDEPPPALGTATLEALRSGIYWGAIGGIRHLIELLAQRVEGSPAVYLTGGAAPAVAALLADSGQYVEHLTLGGIALTAAAKMGKQ